MQRVLVELVAVGDLEVRRDTDGDAAEMWPRPQVVAMKCRRGQAPLQIHEEVDTCAWSRRERGDRVAVRAGVQASARAIACDGAARRKLVRKRSPCREQPTRGISVDAHAGGGGVAGHACTGSGSAMIVGTFMRGLREP